tara:strand:+ start:750 stop:3206 length:2457 start_codon:yes stop_codon:yes gene_type:complete
MMNVLPNAEDLSTGRSILFLGAGFSAEAKNVDDISIKSVEDLSNSLLDACEIFESRDDYDLESVSDEYVEKFDEGKIIELLHRNFTAKSTTDDQRVIVCQPWYRVYTTNYDNVVEQIFQERSKPYSIKEIDDKVEAPLQGVTQVLHIYGNILKASPSEFKDKFLLTERQRDSSPFLQSSWYRKFYDDVLAAKHVVFVGFSLSDIDIRRLLKLLPSEALKKIHFVSRSSTARPIQSRLSQFGSVHLIGTEGFARWLGAENVGRPLLSTVEMPFALEEVSFEQQATAQVSPEDIFNLLVSGKVDVEKISAADISESGGSYTISASRESIDRANAASGSGRPILVHGDIGNGKTVYSYQLAYSFSLAGYRVFRMLREPEYPGEVLGFLQAIPDKYVVIFDDLMRFKSIISSVLGIGRNDVVVVATCRTALLETSRLAVESRFSGRSVLEIDLNFASSTRVGAMVRYVAENGLVGEILTRGQTSVKSFVEHECHGQLRDVILKLYKFGSLHDRVASLLQNLLEMEEPVQRITILSALFSVLGFKEYSSLNIVADLAMYDGSSENLRAAYARAELNGLVQVEQSEVAFRSAAFASYMLKNSVGIRLVLDSVRLALVRIEEYFKDEEDFVRLSRSLLKFSNYGDLILSNADEKLVENFYDQCRVLDIAQKQPLYWVQRSISNMSFGRYDISSQFVATAYETAKSIPNFDTYQIETHEAKLILSRTLREGVSERGQKEMGALDLLMGVLARRDDMYHPFSVMRLYLDVVKQWGEGLDVIQKNTLRSAVARAYQKTLHFSDGKKSRYQGIESVRQMLSEAKPILAK